MTGTVTLKFTANTLIDAAEHTLEEWRTMTGDEEAKLPWSTEYTIVKNDRIARGLDEKPLFVTVEIALDAKSLGKELES